MIWYDMFRIRFTRVPRGEWTEEGNSKTFPLSYHNWEGILGCA